MSNDYATWTDWADDHEQEADAELRAESMEQWHDFTEGDCGHEAVDNQGVCENCGDEIEDWEPSDAQIFAQYGQTMEPRAAA